MAAGKWNMQKASGGVASITVADGVGATNIVLPESGTVATTDNIVGFKNYIINGNFDIWQRGTSQTTGGYGSDDRWSNDNNISTKTHSLVNATDTERALFNSSKFSRTVCVTGGTGASGTIKHTKIEDVTKLAGKTVTLSFWAKADSNRNIAIEFQQVFGTGGSPSAEYSNGGQLVALTSTWQKKSITITLPSLIGKTLGTDGVHTSYTRIAFWFEAGSSWSPTYIPTLGTQSGTFDIAQVQLEVGDVATPFENRPYGLELSLCQRYYEVFKSTGPIGNALVAVNYQASTSPVSTLKFSVDKRIIPTVSCTNNGAIRYVTNNGLNPGASLLTFYTSVSTVTLACTSTPVASFGWMDSFGDIIISAEM